MITQFTGSAIAVTPTGSDRAALTTCADCPYFTADQGVHGWCQAFDKSARPHHEKTKACDQEIEVVEHSHHITKPAAGGQEKEIEHTIDPAQSYKTPPLTDTERHIIAALLAWESRYFVSAEEILEVVSVGKTAWVALSRNRTVPVSASALSSIRRTADQGASL